MFERPQWQRRATQPIGVRTAQWVQGTFLHLCRCPSSPSSVPSPSENLHHGVPETRDLSASVGCNMAGGAVRSDGRSGGIMVMTRENTAGDAAKRTHARTHASLVTGLPAASSGNFTPRGNSVVFGPRVVLALRRRFLMIKVVLTTPYVTSSDKQTAARCLPSSFLPLRSTTTGPATV